MPAAPSAPLPINGRPNNHSVGALITSSAVCNGATLTASAPAYAAALADMVLTNRSCASPTCASSVWNSRAKSPKKFDTAADTSSAAAGTKPTVAGAADAAADLTAAPIPANFADTASSASGAATTCDDTKASRPELDGTEPRRSATDRRTPKTGFRRLSGPGYGAD
ncbi:hypothetical protein IWGMT90018_59980 [Mycobacterium kiyosense]|nr:hypothetical protein IWGMT90018_59980 [Mycobacterium kiyosense]